MVDLDSNPTKLLEVVEVGKQLLMTRGCLTTFSIANEWPSTSPSCRALHGRLPRDRAAQRDGAQLAEERDPLGVIFNALIIVALIPLALRGVQYRRWGGGAAAPLAAGLRAGRRDRPLPGHQGRDLALSAVGLV